MTKNEITNRIAELLLEHQNCGDDKHFLKITLGQIEMVHTAKTLNPKIVLIRIKNCDVKEGFTTVQWTALAKHIDIIFHNLER